jgi:hypothetical protein
METLESNESKEQIVCILWFLFFPSFLIKVKVTIEEATKAQRGSRVIAVLFL